MLTSRFEDALIYATQLHRTQLRKGSAIPYISHLIAVAAIVLEHGGGEDEAIAALLHDAIEDQGGAATRERIRQQFGDRVTEIVDGCTDAETIPKPPWRKRKEDYIAHVARADESIRLVSAADKLHNARSILADFRLMGDALWQRFTGRKAGTLWYYRSLVEAFKAHGPTPLVAELERIVIELESQATASAGSDISSAIE